MTVKHTALQLMHCLILLTGVPSDILDDPASNICRAREVVAGERAAAAARRDAAMQYRLEKSDANFAK